MKNDSPITILIGSDIVPTETNVAVFESGDIKSLIGEHLFNLLESVDYRIFNLEFPLTDIEKPIQKCGPNLIAPTAAIKGIKALNPSLLCLGNNHILDQDEQGLYSTIKVLEENNISYVGAGCNLSEAAKPGYIESNGVKIGIYACGEHEFTIASENRAGANPIDPLESLDHICKLKQECDYVVVLFHGGSEEYPYPTPYLQKVCRKIVEKGADLVICQHSHTIGSYEEYIGKTIVYGQGNFLFDYVDDGDVNECWQTSLLIKFSISDKSKVEFIPICKNGNGVVLAEGEEKEKILKLFFERSKQTLEPGFVEDEYKRLCIKRREGYLNALFGKRRDFNKDQISHILNYLKCESHIAILTNIFEKELFD